MVELKNMKHTEISFDEMPSYFRSIEVKSNRHPIYWNTYVRFSEVIDSRNPYFGTQEKQCAGHICRVLCPNTTTDESLVIRDDGTVWKVWFSNFKEIEILDVAALN